MTEDVIKSSHEILKKHICTLKKASLDDCKGINMCESSLKVINFDKIPNDYSKGKGWAAVPKSNDALYISQDSGWYFIEFKNGSIDKADIYQKIYDSIIMLIESKIILDFDFVRKNIKYILVYNSDKQAKIQRSEAREMTFAHISKLAKVEEVLFGIDKFQGYLFNEVHTYSKELFFEKFIRPMEAQEHIWV